MTYQLYKLDHPAMLKSLTDKFPNLKKITDTRLKKTAKNGFTIIEATLAITILTIGLMAVVEFFPFTIRIIGDSQNMAVASNLALSKIEEINSMPYENISVGTIETKQRVSNDAEDYLYNFRRQTNVEYIDSNLNPSATDNGLKKITVTAYWQSPVISNEKSTQISTIIANY